MRKVTEQTVTAFMNGKKRSVGNTQSTGDALYLHGNMIAMRTGGKVLVSNADWATPTTRERLNGFPDVRFYQNKGRQMVAFCRDNDKGQEWNGGWIWIGAENLSEAYEAAHVALGDRS